MTGLTNPEADLEQVDEEGEEGSYYSGSESDEDTIDEGPLLYNFLQL